MLSMDIDLIQINIYAFYRLSIDENKSIHFKGFLNLKDMFCLLKLMNCQKQKFKIFSEIIFIVHWSQIVAQTVHNIIFWFLHIMYTHISYFICIF